MFSPKREGHHLQLIENKRDETPTVMLYPPSGKAPQARWSHRRTKQAGEEKGKEVSFQTSRELSRLEPERKKKGKGFRPMPKSKENTVIEEKRRVLVPPQKKFRT